jgi:hypothetical protein
MRLMCCCDEALSPVRVRNPPKRVEAGELEGAHGVGGVELGEQDVEERGGCRDGRNRPSFGTQRGSIEGRESQLRPERESERDVAETAHERRAHSVCCRDF